MKTIISAILFALFLVGCGHNEVIKEKIVYKNSYIVTAPTDIQLKKVTVVTPPDKEVWLSLSDNTTPNWIKKEDLLTDAFIKQTSAVQQCNASLDGLRKWRDEQVDLYKQKEQKEQGVSP